MKKLIIYPDNIQRDLNVLSAKAGKSLTKYIEDLLVEHVECNKEA